MTDQEQIVQFGKQAYECDKYHILFVRFITAISQDMNYAKDGYERR